MGYIYVGKRGPKKNTNVVREGNGRASRKKPDVMAALNRQFDADQRNTMRTAIEARHRVHGTGIELSVDQMAGSFVGRLCLSGQLTERQHEAARTYLSNWQDMSIAINGPRGMGAVNLNATRGESGIENVVFSTEAVANWRVVCAVLQAGQDTARNCASLKAALDYCVLRDQDHPHMVPWLRIALDTLADHYRIGDKRKADGKAHHPAVLAA